MNYVSIKTYFCLVTSIYKEYSKIHALSTSASRRDQLLKTFNTIESELHRDFKISSARIRLPVRIRSNSKVKVSSKDRVLQNI